MKGITKDKAKAIAYCLKNNRKVIWLDDKGFWHCALDRNNTPGWAVEAHDVREKSDAR